MNIGLIIVGDEILSGKRRDQHLPKVIELLAARGLMLSWARYVGDDRARITADLKHAFVSGDLVFSCGGIGATPDDHTRQCAAAALGAELALHPMARDLILERMRDVATEQGVPYEPDRADNQHRLNMGVFPVGARIIPNPYNKIAGFSCGRRALCAGLPGHGLADDRMGAGPPLPASAWRCTHGGALGDRFGAMEATLTPLMEQIEARSPRRQGLQPAQRGPPRIRPPHRAGREGPRRPP
jgi:molybdopterin-biosynthesis enzyme MoeA-like protein